MMNTTSDIPSVRLTRTAEIHNFVYDPVQVKRFATVIQTEGGVHQLFLAARRKYMPVEEKVPSMNHVNIQTLYNSSPEQYLARVRTFELEVGSYERAETLFTPECLVIYSTTNSRNIKKAITKIVPELIHMGFNGDFDFNLNKEITSAVMKSRGTLEWLTIDIDDKEPGSLSTVTKFLQEEDIVFLAIETHGGYHVLFDPSLGNNQKVVPRFNDKYTIGDTFCPVPGTVQGGFPVAFLGDSRWWLEEQEEREVSNNDQKLVISP